MIVCIQVFSNAFDSVNHGSWLITKWFEIYSMGRIQYVKFKKFVSDAIDVLSKVPQDSLLDHILFVIFISDVCTAFKDIEFLLSADNLKVYRSTSSIDDVYLDALF